MSYTHTLHPRYLSDLIEKQTLSHLYLKNGHKLRGFLTGMSGEAIFFKENTTEIYQKRMIHGIFPVIQPDL